MEIINLIFWFIFCVTGAAYFVIEILNHFHKRKKNTIDEAIKRMSEDAIILIKNGTITWDITNDKLKKRAIFKITVEEQDI
jgi:hypothetical protein